MGEAKRKRDKMTEEQQRLYALEKELANKGLYIKAGWMGLQKMWWPNGGAPKVQLEEMEKAFFAGCLHMFTGIVNTSDPDREPTAADMRRMDLMWAELEEFRDNVLLKMTTEGTA
jgi:hypothetical protein